MINLLTNNQKQKIIEDILTNKNNQQNFLQLMKKRQDKGIIIAKKFANLLKQYYGVSKVILFGSLLDYKKMNFKKELLELIKTNNNTIYSEGLVSGLALYLENFYGGIERIFSLIGKDVDGSIPSGESWHIQLLNRMLIDIPSVRYAVISQNT